MGYVIKFEEIFNVSMTITNQFGARLTALNNLSNAIEKLINCTSFTGKSAESIKVYFKEVHGTLICGIIELLQLIQSNYLLYFNEYYYIEGSREAVITEETLNNVINTSEQLLYDMLECKSEFVYKVREINDIYFPGNPDIQYLLDHILWARESLESYRDKIEEHERF